LSWGTRAIYFSSFLRYRFISSHSSEEMRL
jgi:hypothetical protein